MALLFVRGDSGQGWVNSHSPITSPCPSGMKPQPVKPGRVWERGPVWVQVRGILQETKRSKNLRKVVLSATFYSYISELVILPRAG